MTCCGVSENLLLNSNPKNLLRSVNLIKWKSFVILKMLILLELLFWSVELLYIILMEYAFYKFECNTNLFVCLFKYVYLAYSVSSISDHKNMHYLGVFKGISQMIENQNFGFLICKSFELQSI